MKKSKFSIDVGDEELDSNAPSPSPSSSSTPTRRGPMAAAIVDNSESLKERRVLEEQIRIENDKLAHEHVRLKELGLVMTLIGIDQIDCDKLTRDRNITLDLELDDLVASIKEIGLSNPIHAERTENGRYELIQGLRRLEAYRQLWAETDDPKFAQIPVAIVPDGDELEVSYRMMVDENLVRKDISFAEMAELARSYASNPATSETNVDKAVSSLFKTASYQKRSYIRAFAELLDLIGDGIKYPQLLSRNLGLDLRRALEDDNEKAMLVNTLNDYPMRSAEEEMNLLRQFLAAPSQQDLPVPTPDNKRKKETARSQLSFQFASPMQSGRCTAAKGRIELRADRDFSSIDAKKIERAIAAFFAALNQED